MQALKINEKALGKNHPDIATDLENLALLFQAQGRYPESISLYKRALEIKKKAFSTNHIAVAKTMNKPIS